MLRKILFWFHLVVGISVGVIVFVMSVTGVLLTYEKQVLEWDESRFNVSPNLDKQRLTTDQILNIARAKHPDENHFYIRQLSDQTRAVPVWAGPNSYLISPYSGEILQTGESWVVESVHWLTDLHRWLALEGKNLKLGKGITAYSNLLFMFLIISGAYLWLPRRIRWSSIKQHSLFKRRYKSKQAKHFNWHHVFAVWAIIPLFVITMTATVFHFSWANTALYNMYDEDAPGPRKKRISVALIDGEQSYEHLFSVAKQHAITSGVADWHSMWIEFGRETSRTRFWIDPSLGNSYERAYALFLDNDTAEAVKVKRSEDWSKGDQAWGVARLLHTGEYYGIIGQTVAGLASLAACFLVFTGFTLSWRRFINFRKKNRANLKSNISG